jgi:hypothetical protein
VRTRTVSAPPLATLRGATLKESGIDTTGVAVAVELGAANDAVDCAIVLVAVGGMGVTVAVGGSGVTVEVGVAVGGIAVLVGVLVALGVLVLVTVGVLVGVGGTGWRVVVCPSVDST